MMLTKHGRGCWFTSPEGKTDLVLGTEDLTVGGDAERASLGGARRCCGDAWLAADVAEALQPEDHLRARKAG